jgi:hypothetical protein
MQMQNTIWLGVLMAAIAIVNASLMAWLWRFPMQPDPTGRDPNGVSTAPRSWTNVHRALGYVFVVIYAVLLFEMVPRSWEFRTGTALSVVHGVLGVLIGVLLVVKIAIIRRFQRFGNRLPWIGGTLAATTVLVSALGIVPAWMVLRPMATLSPELRQGRAVVSAKCNQCHGASVIASEREDARKWERITRKMQRFSHRIPGKEPITDQERILAAAYLTHTLGEAEDHDEDDAEERNDDEGDEGGRRGRGRGRGGR